MLLPAVSARLSVIVPGVLYPPVGANCTVVPAPPFTLTTACRPEVEPSPYATTTAYVPVVGAVLVGSEAVSNASRYYAARYYAEPERTGRLRRRPSGGQGDGSAAGS